jgi:hypothetical protein
MTIAQVGDLLLKMRQSLAAIWPWYKKNSAKLTPAQMRAWNLAVWALIDAEIRFIRELSRLGFRTETGVPLAKAIDPNVLYKRLQVGVFAQSGPLGVLPIVVAAVLPWLLAAAGITAVIWVGGMAIADAIQRTSAALHPGEAEALQEAQKIVEDIRTSKSPTAAQDALKAQLQILEKQLKLEEIRGRLPSWAKGAIAVGVVAVVGLAVWKLAPLLTTKGA